MSDIEYFYCILVHEHGPFLSNDGVTWELDNAMKFHSYSSVRRYIESYGDIEEWLVSVCEG